MSVVTYAYARAVIAELDVARRNRFAMQVASSYFFANEEDARAKQDIEGLVAMTSVVAALIAGYSASVILGPTSADDLPGFEFFPDLGPASEREEAQP
jgi:hypothetical protein